MDGTGGNLLLNRERADAVMDEHGLAALVATTPVNVYYLTDFETDGGWAFPGISAAIVPRSLDVPAAVLTIDVDRDWPGAREASWVPEVRGYPGMEALVTRHSIALETGDHVVDPPGDDRAFDPVAAVAAYLAEAGLASARLGFEDPWFGQRVRERGGEAIEVVPALELLRHVRMVKTPDELVRLRAGSAKNERALFVAMEAVAAGASFDEARRAYHTAMVAMGGDGRYCIGVVSRPGVGPVADDRPRAPGDAVFFDCFGGVRHYNGDVGRTAIVAPPDPRQCDAFRAVRAGWRAALACIRPGVDSRDLAATVMDTVRAAGGDAYLVCSPHSVGLEHFDQPHPRSIYEPFVLEAGMVLSVDMPYDAPDVGMLHSEDLVLVREGDPEVLTSDDDRLCVLEGDTLHRID
ncbi:MAG TPA: Xaa-Pro peptidase family protein [Acidimicrobiia bacterium]